MTEETKARKLRRLKDPNTVGNYKTYLKNIYNFYSSKCKENNSDWCNDISLGKLVQIAYGDLPIDHMGFSMVQEWKKELRELGYLKSVNINGHWRVYITKELDF